ncbi:MAG TPA: hypothetical protein VN648_03720 [Candidatus Methylomirabilis sp.]|nr:hypothetical protein [Candidatus Methylomirabilis sp.]
MGIQVCDQAGRVNCVIPTPNEKVSKLCFGGAQFDVLPWRIRYSHIIHPQHTEHTGVESSYGRVVVSAAA